MREFSYQWLHSTHESSRTKRSSHTQEKQTEEIIKVRAEINRIGTKKQCKESVKQKLVLWENQQERQTLICTN